jgi:hypothetical protein
MIEYCDIFQNCFSREKTKISLEKSMLINGIKGIDLRLIGFKKIV